MNQLIGVLLLISCSANICMEPTTHRKKNSFSRIKSLRSLCAQVIITSPKIELIQALVTIAPQSQQKKFFTDLSLKIIKTKYQATLISPNEKMTPIVNYLFNHLVALEKISDHFEFWITNAILQQNNGVAKNIQQEALHQDFAQQFALQELVAIGATKTHTTFILKNPYFQNPQALSLLSRPRNKITNSCLLFDLIKSYQQPPSFETQNWWYDTRIYNLVNYVNSALPLTKCTYDQKTILHLAIHHTLRITTLKFLLEKSQLLLSSEEFLAFINHQDMEQATALYRALKLYETAKTWDNLGRIAALLEKKAWDFRSFLEAIKINDSLLLLSIVDAAPASQDKIFLQQCIKSYKPFY